MALASACGNHKYKLDGEEKTTPATDKEKLFLIDGGADKIDDFFETMVVGNKVWCVLVCVRLYGRA